jgi:hypothetical protein
MLTTRRGHIPAYQSTSTQTPTKNNQQQQTNQHHRDMEISKLKRNLAF